MEFGPLAPLHVPRIWGVTTACWRLALVISSAATVSCSRLREAPLEMSVGGGCQDWFFTDLISMRGQGVRGWPSGKTEMLHSIVALPE